MSRLSSTLSRWLMAHKDKASFGTKSLNKHWIHTPEQLTNSTVSYNVKFLGEVEVTEPKGTDIVREAVHKMQFNYQIKKPEGEKLAKVDIIICVDNVKIQDSKTKIILHEYPLHRISYCADENTHHNRVFAFIAKQINSNRHFCYAFDSNKCSEDITLTVGQAFDLAYRRYLDNNRKDGDSHKVAELQLQVAKLSQENETLKSRISCLEQLKDKSQIEQYKQQNHILNLKSCDITTKNSQPMSQSSKTKAVSALSDEILASRSVVGRKLEHLVYGDEPSQNKQHQSQSSPSLVPVPTITPPPATNKHRPNSTHSPSNGVLSSGTQPGVVAGDLLDVGQVTVDAFGMTAFTPRMQHVDQMTPHTEKEYSEMQSGFSTGLSFGTEDFNLADLDPLNS